MKKLGNVNLIKISQSYEYILFLGQSLLLSYPDDLFSAFVAIFVYNGAFPIPYKELEHFQCTRLHNEKIKDQ